VCSVPLSLPIPQGRSLLTTSARGDVRLPNKTAGHRQTSAGNVWSPPFDHSLGALGPRWRQCTGAAALHLWGARQGAMSVLRDNPTGQGRGHLRGSSSPRRLFHTPCSGSRLDVSLFRTYEQPAPFLATPALQDRGERGRGHKSAEASPEAPREGDQPPLALPPLPPGPCPVHGLLKMSQKLSLMGLSWPFIPCRTSERAVVTKTRRPRQSLRRNVTSPRRGAVVVPLQDPRPWRSVGV
jgi:hypothetical protein